MAKSTSSRSLSSHPPSRVPSSTGSRSSHDRPATVASGGPGGAVAQAAQHVLGKRKLQELVSQVDPLYRLEPAVEDLFLEVADEFIESVSHMACRLAKHRRGDTLEVRDVQMHLGKGFVY
ncbi:MAG: transcription initiation factor TFIID subunit A-domain-containing protein [Piptocephalis tieghemiana]|nr:MAG: transcription initiation factor TFIID subunit A-domain-containing protein [Piptocephalis tieghemiana]